VDAIARIRAGRVVVILRHVEDVHARVEQLVCTGPLLVTGGVGATNARAFLDAGAVAVGVGSALAGEDKAARLVAALKR